MEKRILFPFSRVHNPLLLEAHLENGKITEALISDSLYRGFEQILIGRPAQDMPYYTQRICGICSSAHALVSALAVERALGISIPPNGLLLRNLILACDFLQNHLRQIYLLALPDYFRGPDIAPFTPHPQGDYRLNLQEEAAFTEHYFLSIKASRAAHAAFAVFGGKAPHGHGIVAGGVTMDIDSDKIMRFQGYLNQIQAFIESYLLPDMELLAKRYPEYLDAGKSQGNHLSVGGFADNEGNALFSQGVLINGSKSDFDQAQVTEDVTSAWYRQTGPLHPSVGQTVPDRGQPQGYTWVKAPRYLEKAMEVGPLSRMLVAGEKAPGLGAIGRLWARALETRKLANACHGWLARLIPGNSAISTVTQTDSGTGIGLHESMRGTLGHWIEVKNGQITHYQIVTPSAWNFSSRDQSGTRGIGETSLLGLAADTAELQMASRVIRSLDPCFTCTVHLLEGENLCSFEVRV